MLNAAGELAFLGYTSPNADGGNRGIFSTAGGALHAVAFEGQIVTINGVDVPITGGFNRLVTNATGDVAFVGSAGANTGIFSTINGELEVLAIEGGQIEVTPGDFRTVEMTYNGAFAPQLNDKGQIAFFAEFADGSSGIFLATPVPEPTITVLVMSGLVACFCWMSRMRPDSTTLVEPGG